MPLGSDWAFWHIGGMLDETEIHPLFYDAPSTTEIKKLRKRIVRYTLLAGDCCVSLRRRHG